MTTSMTQSVVTVRLNGHPYQMGCDAGQEAHIEKMAEDVNHILKDLKAKSGQIADARLLAMASLILADLKHTAEQKNMPDSTPPSQDTSSQNAPPQNAQIEGLADRLAETLEGMAEKVTMLTARLETL